MADFWVKWTCGLCLFMLPVFLRGADIRTESFQFYGEKIRIEFAENMLQSRPRPSARRSRSPEKEAYIAFYKAYQKTDYQVFINSFLKYKSDLKLNDWFFYQLMREGVRAIYSNLSTRDERLILWALLNLSGYEARLTYLRKQVFVNVFTEDAIYDQPVIKEGGKKYVNLGLIDSPGKTMPAMLYLLDFVPVKSGKPFSFGLQTLPAFAPHPTPKTFSFEWQNTRYELSVQYDEAVINVLKNYPLIGENQYIKAPLSDYARQSLVEAFRPILAGKTTPEALQILIAFTRSLPYQTDEEAYGKNKPMIAEEVFFYPWSDCEDRSALYFHLVKELLDLPVIVLSFSDHVTVAVHCETPLGEYVKYGGQKYYLCDPTGPVNSTDIGRFPTGYRHQNFEVIGACQPD